MKKIRLTWMVVLQLVFLTILIGAIVHYKTNPPWGHSEQQDANEALLRARSAAGGRLSTFEQMMVHKPRAVLDNKKILELKHANVDVDVILQMVRNSTPDYDLSADAVIELKRAGVSPVVILAMIDADRSARGAE